MRYLALATDYDGTIAHDGHVDNGTLEALGRLRASGRKLIMVTGRELRDLKLVFHHFDAFDCIVAENGAVLHEPASGATRAIAAPPPPMFLKALEASKVPVSIGHSIVATVEPHEHAVLAAIRDLGMEWHVIFNKGAVMALPSNVTKATGLSTVLSELGLDPKTVVGIGDAENDHAFLRLCGVSVAVANALPSLKAAVDLVTEGARGAGVTELVKRMLRDDLIDVAPQVAHHEPLAAA